MDWYGPNDTWPRHGRDYFRRALNYARDAGWWFERFSSHAFGKVVCDHDLPEGSRCEFHVYSSGSGSESAAHELRSLVDRCPHKDRSGRARASAVEVATSLLDEADLLIQAGERCMNADNMRAKAEELLELASQATQNAGDALASDESDLMGRAAELESMSIDERDSAEGLADAAGYPAEASVATDPLLEAADERVTTAERRLGPRSSSGRRRSQERQRAAETRTRIQMMQDQLGT